MHRLGALTLALGLTVASVPALAQSGDLPPGVFMGGKTLADARAGTYTLDPDHTAVLARVSHIGYSWSVFRFDTTAGKLVWDPVAPEKSTLSIAVQTASITSNVKGFAATLAGEQFLKSGAFPEATFVSTAFRRTDALRGRVEGNLTLMGRTGPMTFDVELVGAGKGYAERPRLGVHAQAAIVPKDYGLSPVFGDAIEIVVDTEFAREP